MLSLKVILWILVINCGYALYWTHPSIILAVLGLLMGPFGSGWLIAEAYD